MRTSKKSSLDKKFHLVYKTINKLNGLFYIGVHSTDDLHDGYLGSGYLIRKAIKKHGVLNFEREILCFAKSRELAYQLEAELVTEGLIKSRVCYNRAPGGQGGYLGEEAVRKMSKARKGQPTWNAGTGAPPKCICERVLENYTAKLCRQCYRVQCIKNKEIPQVRWYITPEGRFPSVKSAAQASKTSYSNVYRWCLNSSKLGYAVENVSK